MRKPRVVSISAGIAVAMAAAFVAVFALAAPGYAAASDHYVALGDSYASGLGAGSYISSSGSCDRSTKAYPELWAAAHSPGTFNSVACAGATTSTVVSSQLSAVTSSTTLVSITIGGNDVGFSTIMTTCVLQGTTACVNAVQAGENTANTVLPGRLDTVYSGIRSRAPSARVVVLDYPVFYQLGTLCVGLSDTSHKKIDEGINLLDGIISAAATRNGVVFADVRSTFVGHQLCSGHDWLHSLNILNINESYHPTADGQSGGYYPVFNGYSS
ncbi:MAG: SGNH/GDSL hydrolase family protein [Micromonosporaceae bacterium]|nr:SGNH/GDSL hydrolase family protein [Micromonosporaceae bacterium]